MLECTINGWILTLPNAYGFDKFVYTDKQVDDYLMSKYFDEIEDWLLKRDSLYNGCVVTDIVGIASEEFHYKEPTVFTFLFMLGHATKFL